MEHASGMKTHHSPIHILITDLHLIITLFAVHMSVAQPSTNGSICIVMQQEVWWTHKDSSVSRAAPW